MMCKKLIYTICAFLLCVCNVKAQDTKLEVPVVDNSKHAKENQVLIIIQSNSESLSMKHSMGDEVAVKTSNNNGTYNYTITYNFPEDYDDSFMKTQLILRLDAGQETVPLTMYKGKVYVGSFFEMLKLNIKKDTDAVFPYEKSAKISFISALDNLSIRCNQSLCFQDGMAKDLPRTNIKTAVNDLDGQKEYVMIFSLDDAKPADVYLKNNLQFEIMCPGFMKNVTSLASLSSRTCYNYMVVSNVKIIEKEVTFEDLCSIADTYERDYTTKFTSQYFAAAADAFEAARDHKDCPFNKKDALQLKVNKFKLIRNYTNRIEQADSRWKAIKEKEGFESKNVWKYLSFECRQFEKLLGEFPEVSSYYSALYKEVEKQYKAHPLSTTTYPVIQGSVTAGEGWFLPVDGTQIYLLSTPAHSLKDVKDKTPVAYVKNGRYKFFLKDAYASYLYFAGESDSHYLSDKSSQTIDVELTR